MDTDLGIKLHKDFSAQRSQFEMGTAESTGALWFAATHQGFVAEIESSSR